MGAIMLVIYDSVTVVRTPYLSCGLMDASGEPTPPSEEGKHGR